MKVLITDKAHSDIDEFKSISKASDKTLNNYVVSLLKYALTLGTFPEIGKYDFTVVTKKQKYEIRSLIYRQHKILYYVDSAVHIVGFLHTKQDLKKYVKKLKRFIDF